MARHEKTTTGRTQPPPSCLFEAHWTPRWFGHDQPIALGQEADFGFRPPGPSAGSSGFTVLSAGADPRVTARCQVVDLRHAHLGALRAIEVSPDGYVFICTNGLSVHVSLEGQLLDPAAIPPPDWTVRTLMKLSKPGHSTTC